MLFETKISIMGILNVTPDSFSGDGLTCLDDQLIQALAMIEGGADIIDIGGESTRPDAVPISEDEELSRVIPIIEKLSRETNTPISIDTMKSVVADKAMNAGASIINDVKGGQGDGQMLSIMAKHNKLVILMHNRAQWQQSHGDKKARSYDAPRYDDFIQDLCADLEVLADKAQKAGVQKDHIILDPGIGFGKTVEQNCLILKELNVIKALGYPILIGASRKSFIGKVLDCTVEERLEGTHAANAVAVMNGASILRVHDVAEARRLADMAYAIKEA